jgi:hypothetical protein
MLAHKIATMLGVLALARLAEVGAAAGAVDGRFGIALAPVATGGKEAVVESESLIGRVLDNIANKGRQGSGFNPLCYKAFAGKPVYSTGATGLNFEHIFNGVAADKTISMFTPRSDPVELLEMSTNAVKLHWPVERSTWGTDCEMTYTFADRDTIDIGFSVTPTQERFRQGYAAFMWAGYLACARDRKIHFYGVDGSREGWVTFGEDVAVGFETGTISCQGVAPLPYERDSQALNIVEHPSKHFLKPFYYGLIDGDHDLATTNDTLAYIMMFDQTTTIRFAMWNFVRDAAGHPDPHRPAWDWQFVIQKPVLGRQYRFRARLVIRPFVSREEILHMYEKWAGPLPTRASRN